MDQKGAFPLTEPIETLSSEERQAYEYLHSVKSEALSFSFPYKQQESTTNPVISYSPVLELEPWQQRLLSDFKALKNRIQQDPQSPQAIRSWPETSAQWRKHITETPPPPYASIHSMDHVTAIRLIANLTKWLSSKINENMSQWIYVMFLRVDNVLYHEDCAVIRGIGKKAAKLLANAEASGFSAMTTYTLTFIVVLVNTYYGQKDIPIPPSH